MCSTCPFRPGSPYAYLVPGLSDSALTEGSRECHQTGTNAVGGRTGKKPRLCRGARDLQIRVMHALGVLKEPTDKGWDEARKRLGC